jgi:hypothetical protein
MCLIHSTYFFNYMKYQNMVKSEQRPGYNKFHIYQYNIVTTLNSSVNIRLYYTENLSLWQDIPIGEKDI